jgi:hypothetical protein
MAVAEAKLDNLPGGFVADPGSTRFRRAAQASSSLVCEARR